MPFSGKNLHWTQRVALIRSSLHSASRSGDFTFFKSLQAASMLEGTNHVAVLSAEMGDDVDTLLAAMDNLNAGLAYVHQDAFQKVFDGLKFSMKEEVTFDSKKAQLYVDITMQRNTMAMAIDKMTNSAIALINNQSETFQESAANVWITGATIIADCIEITLKEMMLLESKLTDFIRIEESWNAVKSANVAAVTGLKGVFWLMDTSHSPNPMDFKNPPAAARSSSIASAGAGMFRRLSTAFAPAPSAGSNTSRSSSVASAGTSSLQQSRANSLSINPMPSPGSSTPEYRTPNYVRNSISTGCPTSMPSNFEAFRRNLSTIPPTPAQDDDRDPLDTSTAPPLPEMPVLPEMIAVPNVPIDERQGVVA